jgi:aldose 1-epimerase
VSDDGEEGFPGMVSVEAGFYITEDNELYMTWNAELMSKGGDYMTPVCLTNHAYWNLSGDFEHKTIHEHTLKLPNCSKYFVLESDLIPTGEHRDVSGTPFDFVEGGKIGDKERLSGAIDGGG